MPFEIANLKPSLGIFSRHRILVISVISISYANICYLCIWGIIFPEQKQRYFLADAFSPQVYLGALVGMIGLALVMFIVVWAVWESRSRVIRGSLIMASLLLSAIPVDFASKSVAHIILPDSDWNRERSLLIYITAAFALGLVYRQRLFTVFVLAVAIFFPYAIFNCCRAMFYACYSVGEEKIHTPVFQSKSTNDEKPRIIFIIFDELDQAAITNKRPASVHLKAVSNLTENSVSVDRAYPPAGNTKTSIPALLLGKHLDKSSPLSADTLQIRILGEERLQPFLSENTVFGTFLKHGLVTYAYGWYHPYPRLINNRGTLVAKTWGFSPIAERPSGGIVAAMLDQYGALFDPRHGRKTLAQRYRDLHALALSAVADPEASFVFLHYGIPHTPGVYDASEGKYSSKRNDDVSGYYANLMLVDKTLAELQAAIETADLSKRTFIVLSSDHWWRSSPWISEGDWRVPFIVHAPVGSAERIQNVPMSTIAIKELVEEIAFGSTLRTNQDIARWLRARRDQVPSGYKEAIPSFEAR